MKYYTFKCGCSFPIVRDLGPNKIPLCRFTKDSYREDCPEVWKLFAEGRTLGVFQLEKALGQIWSKELKPTCVEHLAALCSVLRPGCLNSELEDGESVTKHYCLRKNDKEAVEYPIRALQPILKDTYGLNIFQESSIRLGQEIAGFSLGESDYYLRKAIGKKDAKLLFETESHFLEGCKKVGKVTEEEAKIIFNSIKASARYAFNKSHAAQYGIHSFKEMYGKAHFVLHFYTSKMKSPRKSTEQEDIANLIYDAKNFNIKTKAPDLRDMRPEFYNDGQHIYIGLTNIRDFGQSSFAELKEAIEKNKELFLGVEGGEASFMDFAINSARYLSPSSVCLLIESGSVDWLGLPRSQMLDEFKLISGMTKTEKALLFKYYDAAKAGVKFNE